MASRDIFISYRRESGAGHAGRLHDTLEHRLGHGRVFIDASAITPGEPFPRALAKALAGCRAVIVLIGPGWAEVADERGRRLDRGDDWVRIEVEAALAGHARIVPALVAEARMPRADELPAALRALAEYQAIDLRSASWDDDVRRLVAALGLGPSPRRRAEGVWKALGDRLGALPRGVAAVAVGALGGTAIWALFHSIMPTAPTTPAAGNEAGSAVGTGTVYDQRLTSTSPTQAEQEALAQRFAGRGLTVPLLRRFLAIAANEGLPAPALDAALSRYALLLQQLRDRSAYDDTGQFFDDMNGSARQGLRLVALGQFDEARAAFAACAPVARSETGTKAGTLRAWCAWLGGLLEAVVRQPAQALALFAQAEHELAGLGRGGARLRVAVLSSRAETMAASADRDGAIIAFDAAAAEARPIADHRLPDLLLRAAAGLEAAGRDADALQRREEALRVMESDGRRIGSDERAIANRVVAAYDKAGRDAEAAALRERFGLAPR